MKKFDILRYLRRLFALVLAVTMAGTVVVYWYCKNNQTYTASVNIKYSTTSYHIKLPRTAPP